MESSRHLKASFIAMHADKWWPTIVFLSSRRHLDEQLARRCMTDFSSIHMILWAGCIRSVSSKVPDVAMIIDRCHQTPTHRVAGMISIRQHTLAIIRTFVHHTIVIGNIIMGEHFSRFIYQRD